LEGECLDRILSVLLFGEDPHGISMRWWHWKAKAKREKLINGKIVCINMNEGIEDLRQ